MRIPARVRVSWKGRGGTLFTQNAYSLNSDRAPEGRQKVARRFIAGSRRYKKSFLESRRDDWGSAHVQSSLRDTSNLFVFGFRNPAINRRATLTSSLRDEETLEKGRRRTIGGGIHGVKEISVLHKEGSPNLTVLKAHSYKSMRWQQKVPFEKACALAPRQPQVTEHATFLLAIALSVRYSTSIAEPGIGQSWGATVACLSGLPSAVIGDNPDHLYGPE